MDVKQLGSGVNTAAIYDRLGTTMVMPLDGVTNLEWGRVRNDLSIGKVSIGVGQARECWRQLGGVHTWGHSLVISRDGRRVWEGPIRRTPYVSDGTATIEAVDVLGWTKRRRVRAARKFSEKNPVLKSVVAEAERSLRLAFAIDDPNVLAHLLVLRHTTEAMITRAVEANTTYHYDDLMTMCGQQGAHVTTVGRRIIIWPERKLIGQTSELLPGRHLTAAIETSESGDDLCTVATSTGTDGVVGTYSAPGLVNGVDPFYGLHDRLFEGGEVKTPAPLVAQSRSIISQLYPAPTLLSIPEGAALNCDAPFTIEELVPGTLVPVNSSETARRLKTTMVLQSMNVTQDGDGETVTINLQPASQLAGTS